MKEIKEPLARLANKEDNTKGTFFEGRYKSIAILDEKALLAACVYIDLNPLAAGLAETPEASVFTSISHRIRHLIEKHGGLSLAPAGDKASVSVKLLPAFENELWLAPIENRRRFGSPVEGMFEGLTLSEYLNLVDYTGRLHRPGKASIAPETEHIFKRLGLSLDAWEEQQFRLAGSELKGRFLSTSRSLLRSAASQLGLHHCLNLNGCFAA